MNSNLIQDRRFAEREKRLGRLTDKELEKYLADLPDQAANVEPRTDEEIATLRKELAEEQIARDARIERAKNEPLLAKVPVPPPVIPYDDDDF